MADQNINIQVQITDNSPEVLRAVGIAIRRALHSCGENARSHAYHNAPFKTGNLRNSITHQTQGNTEIIGTNVEYALAQELGTSRGIRAKHYMKNAVANNTAEYKNIIKDSLINA